MSGNTIELKPVDRITANCKGEPGNRTFFIQGRQDFQLVTLLVEKFQVQQLATGIAQFVQQLQEKFPDLTPATSDYYTPNMLLEPPVDAMFRVAQIGLGYDEDADLVVLVAQENDQDEDDSRIVRFWATRSQMLAMGAYGAWVASQGRQICGNCLSPIDADGHFCPQRNGHRH